MKRTVKIVALLVLQLSMAAGGFAQSSVKHGYQKSLLGIEVHFRFDKSLLDLHYMGNAQALERFAYVIDSIGLSKIDSVVIVSQSSPEGVYEHNLKLSRLRAATMHRTIGQRHPELNDRLYMHPDGESWERLREYVTSDKKMKQTTIDKVVSIIDSDVNVGTKKWRLQQLPIYRYLVQTYYPRLRNSVFCIVYYETAAVEKIPVEVVGKEEIVEVSEETEVVPADTVSVSEPEPAPAPSPSRKIVWALKSNLLYDLALVPNLGAELRLGKGWSIAGSWEYARWNTDSWCWRIYGGELALRKWLGRTAKERPLSGHHVGVYAQAFTYDFMAFGHKGYMSGEPGDNLFKHPSYVMGVEYGYSLPIARCLNLDFVLGVGYQGGKYNEYRIVDDCYVWQARKNRSFVGPTKAEVSLVWLFGQKGGVR